MVLGSPALAAVTAAGPHALTGAKSADLTMDAVTAWPQVQLRTAEVVASLSWGRAVGRSQPRMGLPARLTLKAAVAGGGDGTPAIHAAAAAELTQRALEWHSAAASGTETVGLGTLAGDYCLAQAAAALSCYGDVDMEAAFADGLTAAGATLAASGSATLATHRLLPACGLTGARAARLPASTQAHWWRTGRRLARSVGAADELPGSARDLESLLAGTDPLEQLLGRILAVDPASVAGPMATLLSAGGKRIRSRLVLLSGEIGGRFRPDGLLQGAAAMELLHAATLCHDDLVDGASSRRGAPTVAAMAGPLAALGVGDFYLGRASALIARLGDPRISRDFARSLVEIADGQLLELNRRSVWTGELAPYIRVAQLKTGSLLAVCATIGARVGGASAPQIRAVARFARRLGLAFQGIDDCLDFSDPERTGKPAGTDLVQGICGLPVLCALRGPQRKLVLANLRCMDSAEGAEAAAVRDQVLALVRETGALATARTVADGWSSEAIASIEGLPGPIRHRLEDFADRLTLRDR
jgi:heptaprenyl diphosphate synthase